ncbi:hypothetical protein RR48_00315 [Papilio machaon]|uniref:Uncharacterized protein n=1 Tax=Papilio machaon TaxID=76193 RepID=A0A0N1IHT2_PAPMA|nr:hypothetical protein RR48_00315 [Papilio machaon]
MPMEIAISVRNGDLSKSSGGPRDWNTPGTSKEPTVAPPSMLSPPAPTEGHPTSPPNAHVEEEWKPPPQKKFKNNNEVIKMLIKGDMLGSVIGYMRRQKRKY